MRAPTPRAVQEDRVVTPAFVKDRARLLRQELAHAGFEIPHSLALELLAHQHGFRDWNTLVASDGMRRPTEPHLERETDLHSATTMTLGELRAVIAGHSDDTPVLVSCPTEPGSTVWSTLMAGSAAVEPNLLTDSRPALIVSGTFPTGRYLVPRQLVLELSGLPVAGGPVVAAVIDAVRLAVDELGFRGERSMSNDDSRGVVTWRFKASAELPLSAVEDAARRVIQRHNPGSWTLRSG